MMVSARRAVESHPAALVKVFEYDPDTVYVCPFHTKESQAMARLAEDEM